MLASVGLDRYLRLHSMHSRQLLAKVYCKTLPTGAASACLPACALYILQPLPLLCYGSPAPCGLACLLLA